MEEEERKHDIFDLKKGKTKGKSGQLLQKPIPYITYSSKSKSPS